MLKSALLGAFLSLVAAGQAAAYTISGYVTTSFGAGVSGVTVTFSNSGGSAVTSRTGYYSCTMPTGWTGSAVPSQAGYYFSPSSRLYLRFTSNQTDQNYVRYVQTYTVGGYVLNAGGSALQGIPVVFSNGDTVETDTAGYYSSVVSYNWSGTVTPTSARYTFSPTSITLSNVLADQEDQDFTGTLNTYRISGYVRDTSGTAISGATVVFSNRGGTATTSSTGYYYKYVTHGWSGTTTPSSDAYTFSPASRSYSSVASSYYSQNFAGTLNTYTIGGSVTYGGQPLAATVTFSNGGGTAVVGKLGTYSVTVDYGWSGTATPSATGYTFSPTSRTYGSVDSSCSAQNYVASKVTRYVSGYVYTPTGAAMEGATVTFSNGGGTATTSATGYYYKYLDYGWSGTATPSATGYTFTPEYRTYGNLTSNTSGQNFTAAYVTYTVSGYVMSSVFRSTPIQSVTVTFSNGGGSVVTGKTGYYSNTVNYGWSGTVVPSKTGYSFSPSYLAFSSVTADYADQDFEGALNTYTVSGTIVDTAGDPVEGVLVTLSNSGGSDVTDANGYYAEAVNYGWSGTVTPSCSSHTFDPEYLSLTSVISNRSGNDFTGTINSYPISGDVYELPFNQELKGPKVYVSEIGTSYTCYDAGLMYVFSNHFTASVPYGWSGWVKPVYEGWQFFPDSTEFINVTAPETLDLYGDQIRYVVSGTVATVAGEPIDNVDIVDPVDGTISGRTGEDGEYSVYVDYGWSGTLKVGSEFCTAYGESTVYAPVYSDIDGQNYTGDYNWVTVDGLVYSGTIFRQTAITGVEISVSAPYGYPGDTTVYTTIKSKEGTNYSVRILPGISHSFWPQKTGYDFTPSMYYPASETTIDVHGVLVGSITASGYTVCGSTVVESTVVEFDDGIYSVLSDSNGYFETSLFFNLPVDDKTYYNGPLSLRHDDYVFLPADTSYDSISVDTMLGTFNARLKYQYEVEASAGTGGGIAPDGLTYVKEMTEQPYVITPDSGYAVSDVVVNGVSYGAIPGFLFDNVDSNQTITAAFEPAGTTYTVSVRAFTIGNDSLVPEDSSVVPYDDFCVNAGSDVRLSIFPQNFMYYPSVFINGIKDTVNTLRISDYRFETLIEDISDDLVVWIVYKGPIPVNGTVLSLFALEGGSVDPAGMCFVLNGMDKTVDIIPDTGHHIVDVLIDYSYAGAIESYTFESVSGPHTVVAAFAKDTFVVASSAGVGGTIWPDGTYDYLYGDTVTYLMTPATGYRLDSVVVDSINGGTPGSYMFNAIADSHEITAYFSPQPYDLIAAAGTGGSVTPAGTTAITYFDTVTVTIAPDAGYEIGTVLLNDSAVAADTAFTFAGVQEDQSLLVGFVLKEYDVVASAGTGGAVSPAGSLAVTHGDSVTFDITPAVGYDVSGILVDGVPSGSDTLYVLGPVTGDATVLAQFSLQSFSIIASAGAGGQVSPAGTSAVTYGDTLTVSVLPDSGYQVDALTVDGTDIGAADEYEFAYITTDHAVTAAFRRLEYTVNASAGTGGTVSPAGDSTVLHGDTVVYVVTPSTGYDIADVLVDSVSVGAVDTVTLAGITTDMTVRAVFVLETYAMVGTAGSGGSVSPAGTTVVEYGDYLEYAVTPGTGYDIADVLVDGASQGAVATYAFSAIDTGHTVAASFSVRMFTLSASAGSFGNISPAGDSVVVYGGAVTYTVSPDSGYQVADVTVDGASQGGVTELTLAGITADHTVAATFEVIVYEVIAAAGTGGQITPSGTTAVDYGDTLVLTVAPSAGYDIAGVTVDGVPQGAVDSVVLEGITSDRSVTASFVLKTYEIITAAGAGGAVAPAGTTVVDHGDSLAVSVSPAAGYEVTDVTVDGTGLGALASYVFTDVADDHALAATFALRTFTVTAAAGTGGSVSPAGGTVVSYGDTLVVAVTPDAGYDIADVTVGGISQGAVDTVRLEGITANVSVGASFSLRSFVITAAAGTGGAVSPAGSTAVYYGDSLVVGIVPATGYEVAGVTVDGTGLGALTSYTFEGIAADHALAASFSLRQFTVTAAAGAGGSVSPAGGTTVSYGDTLVIVAAPDAGYDISGVTVDGVPQGAVDTVRLEGITADVSVSASFSVKTFSIVVAAGTGGAVSPAGTTVVNYGDSLTVSVTPGTGYDVGGVTVDGTGLGALSAYAFENIKANHALAASFALQSFTVTAAAGMGGSVSPAGASVVDYGDTLLIAVSPAAGYDISGVLVDGVLQGAVDTVRLEGITADVSVSASFSLRTFSIITAAGAGGTVSPAGTTVVQYGDTLTVSVSAATGYDVSGVAVDGTGLGALSAYAFENIKANHALAASFALQSFTVTATAGSGGSVNPAGITAVAYGDSLSIAVVPAGGYLTADVLVDSVSQGALDTVRLEGITADREVHASYVLKTYGVYAAAGTGGSVSPAGTTAVVHGTDHTVTVTAADGYAVEDVLVDGVSAGAVTEYTFNDVDTAHTLTASFSVLTVLHAVYAAADTGGHISPAGTTMVNQGNNITYTVTPADVHWQVADVTVDGVSVGAVGSYAFTGVDTAHTILATFEDSGVPRFFPLYATAGVGGAVSPAGTLSVPYGTDTTIVVTPATGYYVTDVTVDGASQGAIGSHTFTSVTDTHGLAASFGRYQYTVTAAAGAGGSVSPAGSTQAYYGDTLTVAVTPDTGYAVSAVYVDGVNQGAVSSVVLAGITANRSVSALFATVDYVITATAGTGGTISPAGAVNAPHGSDVSFTITPDTGYAVADVLVDGSSQGAITSYTFADVAGSGTISASFTRRSFSVTASAGTGGAVSPAGTTLAYYGDTVTVAVTPDTGYAVSAVYVDGVSQGAVSSVTLAGITANRSVTALFATVDYVISATAGTGGSISPAGAVNASHGSDVSFTITPDTGYAVADVLVDGSSQGAITSYTFTDVAGSGTISASFTRQSFRVVASAGTGGTVSPAGTTQAYYGDTLVIAVAPDSGYAVSAVYVDGVNRGAVGSVTLAGIIANRSVSALFSVSDYTITVAAGTGGSITPSGTVTVSHGSDRAFTVTPDSGYAVADVLVDGSSVGAVSSYTFEDVTASHTISASFALRTWRVVATAGTGGAVSPAGTTAVTHGDSLVVTVTPNAGYAVSAVYAGGVNQGAVSAYTFRGIDGNRTLTAVFSALTYPVAVRAGSYGSAVPAGTTMVAHGDTFTVTVTPNTGFETAMLIVDGDTLAGAGSYSFAGVTGAHSLYASFRERIFSVTATAGSGGTVSPAGDISVPYGTALPFAITPETGYGIASVLVDSVSVGAVSSYTFGAVTADHRIDASFARLAYNVTASASAGGYVSPSGTQFAYHGDTLRFAVVPDSGYYTSAILLDGVAQEIADTLVLAGIDTAHTVAVSFARIRFLVGALTGGPGGSVSPAGSVWVYLGDDQAFSITPDAGYDIEHVMLDGVDQGAVSSLTLTGVDAAHTIIVSFALRQYLVRAVAGNGGVISPAGSLYYDHGADAVFRIIPDSNYSVEKIFVDGMDVGTDTLYTFTGISADHVISAMFVPIIVGVGVPPAGTADAFIRVVPNPVSGGSGVIQFRVEEPGTYGLALLDRNGDELWRTPAGHYGAGVFRLAWPVAEPGVYLLRLEGAAGGRTAKVLVTE